MKTIDSDIVVSAIAFRINGNIDQATKSIEENIIAPKVCKSLQRRDFVEFFADIIEKNVDFALYLNKIPKKFKD